jgi:hypothetical protein
LTRYLILALTLLFACIPSDTTPDRGGAVVEVIPEVEVYRTTDGWEVTLEQVSARVSFYADGGSSYDEGSRHWDNFAPFRLVQRGSLTGRTQITINVDAWEDYTNSQSTDESGAIREFGGQRSFTLRGTARRNQESVPFWIETGILSSAGERSVVIPANDAVRLRCVLSFRDFFVQADGTSVIPALLRLDDNGDGKISTQEWYGGFGSGGFGTGELGAGSSGLKFPSSREQVPIVTVRWLD